MSRFPAGPLPLLLRKKAPSVYRHATLVSIDTPESEEWKPGLGSAGRA